MNKKESKKVARIRANDDPNGQVITLSIRDTGEGYGVYASDLDTQLYHSRTTYNACLADLQAMYGAWQSFTWL